MREHKYKVWFPKAKRMIHFEGIRFCDEYDTMCFAIGEEDCTIKYQHLAGKSYIPDEEGIPLEYTGLHDKQGKEIYEGDIIGMPHPAKEGMCWEVVWHEYGWHILLHGWDDIPYHVKLGEHINDDEVIGNIYETPELILQWEDVK